jgi:hypothetical protein
VKECVQLHVSAFFTQIYRDPGGVDIIARIILSRKVQLYYPFDYAVVLTGLVSHFFPSWNKWPCTLFQLVEPLG